MITDSDLGLMREAYRIAAAATGNADPNPAVGALVVDRTGKVIGQGATQRAGFAHAERMALKDTPGNVLTTATLYVTLEPCCHHGRTPPCTDVIIEKGIGRVVIGQRDFAAEVAGRSVEILRSAGITIDVIPDDALSVAQWYTTGPFFFSRKYRRPRIVLKWAQTIDGLLAPAAGPSGPISGDAAAIITATLRSWCKFTLASAGTVAVDNPRLTVRFPDDISSLDNCGLSAQFLATIVAHRAQAPLGETVTESYKPPAQGFLKRGENLSDVLLAILSRGYNSVLLEAGPTFSQAVLDADLVDALAVYRSKHRKSADQWRQPARGNSYSVTLAQADDPYLEGFELIERADLGTDDFLFFRRLRND